MSPTTHGSILVVDDEEIMREILQTLLSREGYEVRLAASGEEGLELARAIPFDAALVDIMMPGIDGFEVCERLKANPRTSHIPVVMVTALDQPSDRVRGLKAGADDFLTKPVNDLQLISRVKSLVRLKTLSDELRIRSDTAQDLTLQDMMKSAAGQDAQDDVAQVRRALEAAGIAPADYQA